jgi:hypothetical protein
MEIGCVTVDCADPAKVAAFWNEALHWGGVAASPDGSGAICGTVSGGVYLEFVRNVVLRDVEGNEFCLGAGELP